ncbi:MAG: hypothetical protein J5847_05235 [Clostridia bacterium]|nr:hypothetical protein [Clostridia bacterium]MBR5753623.1 hypothetical protein [Clostridia bacterium]
MTRTAYRPRAILLGLLLTACFILGAVSCTEAWAFFGKTPTTTSSTTRSTTTKIGKTKFDDLQIMQQKDGTWWACNKKTKEKTDYTGIAPTLDQGWWYCRKGKVDKTFTGVAENPFGLWFCKKGKADLDFDGYFVRNSMQIYRIQGGAASLYTTDMELDIPNGVYKDGSEEANEIMDLTEHLFQENISRAAAQGVVRSKNLSMLKRVLLALCAIAFIAYAWYNIRQDKKRDLD